MQLLTSFLEKRDDMLDALKKLAQAPGNHTLTLAYEVATTCDEMHKLIPARPAQ